MDAAFEIHDYLPVYYNNSEEDRYIAFLWESFLSNFESRKFEFANLAFHLLYMSYASFLVWRLRFARRGDFEKAMVGFQNDVENKLFTVDSPFKFYESLKESMIFRFIKLLGCDNQQVGNCAKFVKYRNRIAHPSGTATFNDEIEFSDHICDVLGQMEMMQTKSKAIVLDLFRDFLISDSGNPDVREFSDEESEINSNFIGRFYLSRKDVEICLEFDIAALAKHPNSKAAKSLRDAFVKISSDILEI